MQSFIDFSHESSYWRFDTWMGFFILWERQHFYWFFLKSFWEEQPNRAQPYLQQPLLPCCTAIKAQTGAWSETTAALVKQSVKCFCCTNKRRWIRSSGTEWFLPMNKSTHTLTHKMCFHLTSPETQRVLKKPVALLRAEVKAQWKLPD